MKTQAAALIATFQKAILDLSQKLDAEKSKLSAEAVENTNYVVAMASTNAFNLEQVVKQGTAYYSANKEKVNRLFVEAEAFAESLRAEGFGNT